MTQNKGILSFVEDCKNLCKPKEVVWITGEDSLYQQLREEACASGELIKLNQELLPGCYLHRSDVNDVARVEDRTFICTKEQENAGPINNWMDPQDAYKMAGDLFKDSMKGKTMYVIPYSMGAIDSKFAKFGIEITDSIYVVLSMHIMTRVGNQVLEAMGDSLVFVKGLHSRANLDAEKRYILHFPEDNTILSVNSGYGGNVLLGKKCFALRLASYQGKQEGWFAEHMLILAIEKPNKDVKYVAAAFPSACGKTNLAMLIPPECYLKKGYKVWCIGDDIAWIRLGEDGRLWAINPENGFFGVAPGTNEKSNPNALYSTQKDTIFTNVALNLDNNTVWWEGLDNDPPKNALNWKGEVWDYAKFDKKDKSTYAAHPNSRFTAPIKNCPCLSSEFESPNGVPLSAIIFGGRRAKTTPLVYEAKDWECGVFVGSAMASETTAAATGEVGIVRRDPMAMRPFVGYHMADYFQHWIDMGKKIEKKPKIFNVNWFRTDEDGSFIWPGFGDNFRVLEWILNRCENVVDAIETPIGYVPDIKDVNLEGLDITEKTLKELLKVDSELWAEETDAITSFYNSLGQRVPNELKEKLETLKSQVNKNTN